MEVDDVTRSVFRLGEFPGIPEHLWDTAAELERMVSALDPDWNEGSRVHNWRTHVPGWLQDIWETLPPVARAVAWRLADEQAHDESWE